MKKLSELAAKYPKIFPDRANSLLPYPMFGFECGDGWYNIINQLCLNIQHHIDQTNRLREALLKNNPYNSSIPNEVPQVVADQVKEKFGTLRFYTNATDNCVDGMIQMAEAMSSVTCEVCGNPGQIDYDSSWYSCRCEEHNK